MSSEDDHTDTPTSIRQANVAEQTSSLWTTESLDLAAGIGFSVHSHREDQLAWMRSGAMSVTVDGRTHWLRGSHMIWIPSQVPHAMKILEHGELINLYSDPTLRPVGSRWLRAHPMMGAELPLSLVAALVQPDTNAARQELCHRLLMDLLPDLSPVSVLSTPDDCRARVVADALTADPADPRELGDFAAELGVSERTLLRAFRNGTGTSFRTWRTQRRLYAAAELLAAGESVAESGHQVGYRTPSSFIKAFATQFGVTPGTYARN